MGERYRREIEEILKQAGELSDAGKAREKERHPSRGLRGWLKPKPADRPQRLPAGKVFLASITLLISALVMRAIAPGLVGVLALAGFVLFIVAYAMFCIRSGPTVEKRWRGRRVEEPGEGLLERLRRWLRR